MKILTKLKMLWKLNTLWGIIKDAIKTKEGEMKPGWKTTEFWLTVLTQLGAVVGALQGVIPTDTAAYVSGIITAVYGLVRAITKSNVPAIK